MRLRDEIIAEVQRLQRHATKQSSTPVTLVEDTPLQCDSGALSQEPARESKGQTSPIPNNTPTVSVTAPTLPECILQTVEDHKIEVTIKDLVGILSLLTTYIQDRLFSQPGHPTPSKPTPPLTTTATTVDMHKPVITLMIGRTTVTDVLLDRGLGLNVITEEECKQIGFPKPTPAPFKFKMADGKLSQPLGLLKDVKIQIHGIPYTVTLTLIKC